MPTLSTLPFEQSKNHAVEIMEGQPHKRSQGRTDYTLRIEVTSET